MRKLATIATIATAEPIPEADRLDVVTLAGKDWRIVTGRNEFRPGDRDVYFEIDSGCRPTTNASPSSMTAASAPGATSTATH